jgi:hypothetical protein
MDSEKEPKAFLGLLLLAAKLMMPAPGRGVMGL